MLLLLLLLRLRLLLATKLGEALTQCDCSVEHKLARSAGGVHCKVAQALKLIAVKWLQRRERRAREQQQQWGVGVMSLCVGKMLAVMCACHYVWARCWL